MASTVSFGGVFTDIDWSTIIAKTMASENVPLDRLNEKKTDYQSKQGAIDALNDSFTSFQSAITTLNSGSVLRSVNITSSNTDVATASAGSGAYGGTHTIEVNQLAQANRLAQTAGFTNMTDQIGAGVTYSTARNENSMVGAGQDDATWFTTGANGATYSFQFGSETAVSVTFAANTSYSLNEVADAINTAAGYSMASVVDEGGDTYKLDLTAKSAGEIGTMAQTLTAGDAVDVLNDDVDYVKTDGVDGAAGVFSYTYNGATRNLNLDEGATLQDLRNKINNDSGNPGVTASLIQYNGTYHLVLAGKNTGEDYAITINDAATTFSGFDTADFYTAQAAQNAQYRIDGTPLPGTYIESNSNTITDAVDGVTISLAGTGETTINIAQDTSALKNAVASLVDQYNSLLTTIHVLTGYSKTDEKGGLLQGDSLIQSLLTPIRALLTTTVTGFDSSVETYSMGAQIGISVDRYGEMSFDGDVFDEAVKNDFDAVVDLFGAEGKGYVSDDYFQFDSALDSTKAGSYEVKVDFDALGNITGAWFRDEGDGDGDWREAIVDGNSIVGSLGMDEQGLQITVTWDGVSTTQTSDVRLMNGIGHTLGEQVDYVLDTTNGPLQVRLDSYDSAIEDLDEKIDSMQERLDKKEATLTAKYARLEALLAQMDSQRASYDALFSSLDNNKSDS